MKTPITDDAKFSERGTPLYATVPADLCAAIEREKTFYRDLLQQICADTRKTRARRLAESGLMFWDSMQDEKRNRTNNESASPPRKLADAEAHERDVQNR